ncbi:hypothetical protein GZH49_23315 [Nocardia terpenica]
MCHAGNDGSVTPGTTGALRRERRECHAGNDGSATPGTTGALRRERRERYAGNNGSATPGTTGVSRQEQRECHAGATGVLRQERRECHAGAAGVPLREWREASRRERREARHARMFDASRCFRPMNRPEDPDRRRRNMSTDTDSVRRTLLSGLSSALRHNLLLGMVVGLVLAFGLLLWRVVRVAISVRPVGGGRWLVTVDGACTFLALPRLVGELAAVPPGAPVIVELTVDFLDHAAHDALRDWADGHEKSGGTVEFVEMGAARRLLDDVLGPWRRTAQGDPIVAGVAAYHRRHAHLVRPHLGRLRDVQYPDSLFLTCADSRIVPNVITNSGPGDLFTVRNIGNLVPADGRDSSVEAALVYALDTLRVRSVVVCGHSGCGAMDALFHDRVTGPGLDDWLAHGRPALDRYRAGHPVAAAAAEAGFGEIDRLGMVNVAVQLEALARHPVVRRAMLARGVVLSGLFFDISTARVLEITIDGVDEIEDTTEPATALSV